MPPHRSTANITETEAEYLLAIKDAAQVERAKAIPGYRWDPERVCWGFIRGRLETTMR
jgi:hypothetical protein